MSNDGGNDNDRLVAALPPSRAMNVKLNGIMDSPWPVAVAACSAAVETFKSHEVEHEQHHASQHPQDPAKERSLSQLELVYVMGVHGYTIPCKLQQHLRRGKFNISLSTPT